MLFKSCQKGSGKVVVIAMNVVQNASEAAKKAVEK